MVVVQMECMIVDIVSDDEQVVLCVIGQVVLFEGFIVIYEEGCDDSVVDDDDKCLFYLIVGEKVDKCIVSFE